MAARVKLESDKPKFVTGFHHPAQPEGTNSIGVTRKSSHVPGAGAAGAWFTGAGATSWGGAGAAAGALAGAAVTPQPLPVVAVVS